MTTYDEITDETRLPLSERFEIEAAIRAYRGLGYAADEVIDQMALIFSFKTEDVQPLLQAA